MIALNLDQTPRPQFHTILIVTAHVLAIVQTSAVKLMRFIELYFVGYCIEPDDLYRLRIAFIRRQL